MPTSNPRDTLKPIERGVINHYSNAIEAFSALAEAGIYSLGEMTIAGDFGQDADTSFDSGSAGMGSPGGGLAFNFYNDGRISVYVPD